MNLYVPIPSFMVSLLSKLGYILAAEDLLVSVENLTFSETFWGFANFIIKY